MLSLDPIVIDHFSHSLHWTAALLQMKSSTTYALEYPPVWANVIIGIVGILVQGILGNIHTSSSGIHIWSPSQHSSTLFWVRNSFKIYANESFLNASFDINMS